MNDFDAKENILGNDLKETLIRVSETFIVKITPQCQLSYAYSLTELIAYLSDVINYLVSNFPP